MAAANGGVLASSLKDLGKVGRGLFVCNHIVFDRLRSWHALIPRIFRPSQAHSSKDLAKSADG